LEASIFTGAGTPGQRGSNPRGNPQRKYGSEKRKGVVLGEERPKSRFSAGTVRRKIIVRPKLKEKKSIQKLGGGRENPGIEVYLL